MGFPRFALIALLLISALTLAQTGTPSPSKSKATHPGAAQSAAQNPDPGGITDGVYRNLSFAFGYKIPFGWVERTHEMQGDEMQGEEMQGDDSQGSESQKGISTASKSHVLLALFERPPDAPGNTINSAVIIAAEKISDYPGLKTAADYFGPLAQLVAAKGFQGVSGPDEFAVGTKKLMRGDFAKDMPSPSKDQDRLTMQQSTLVELDHGYIVSFTFIAGDEDDVEDLIGNLSFAARK